jgi:chromosome segregation ATPase
VNQARALVLSSALFSLVAFGQTPSLENQGRSRSISKETLTRQIKVVESQLLELRRIYAENYLDVRRLQGQLEVLESRRDAVDALADAPVLALNDTVGHQIAFIESQLVEWRRIYTESYPDIRRLQDKLQVLRSQVDPLAK